MMKDMQPGQDVLLVAASPGLLNDERLTCPTLGACCGLLGSVSCKP